MNTANSIFSNEPSDILFKCPRIKSARKIKRLTLRNQNCLSRFLFKVLFSTGEFFDFRQAFHFSAFLFGDLIFLLLFLSRKKVVQLIIICLCRWLQYTVKKPPGLIFLLLVLPHISFCLDAKRNKKVKAASAKAEILNVRTKIKELGGCSSVFS